MIGLNLVHLHLVQVIVHLHLVQVIGVGT